jgi:hypothetical protein
MEFKLAELKKEIVDLKEYNKLLSQKKRAIIKANKLENEIKALQNNKIYKSSAICHNEDIITITNEYITMPQSNIMDCITSETCYNEDVITISKEYITMPQSNIMDCITSETCYNEDVITISKEYNVAPILITIQTNTDEFGKYIKLPKNKKQSYHIDSRRKIKTKKQTYFKTPLYTCYNIDEGFTLEFYGSYKERMAMLNGTYYDETDNDDDDDDDDEEEEKEEKILKPPTYDDVIDLTLQELYYAFRPFACHGHKYNKILGKIGIEMGDNEELFNKGKKHNDYPTKKLLDFIRKTL